MREKDIFNNDIIYKSDRGCYEVVFIDKLKHFFGEQKDFNEFQIDSGESQYTYVSVDVCIKMYDYLKERGLVKE